MMSVCPVHFAWSGLQELHCGASEVLLGNGPRMYENDVYSALLEEPHI